MTDPADYSIPEAALALREGRLTARQLVTAALDRIAQRNDRLHAFTHLNPDALAEADRADAMLAAGAAPPLCGIPVAVKDLIDVGGLPATSGSAVLSGRIAAADADAVAQLRAQGAVILGKLATYEFAMVGPDLNLPDPPARNPWNLNHITGGSSSGSASAVAGGLVRLALGTDTGGSIRSPSAYCGCVGLKPSYDRVSRAGAFPLSPALDHTGPLAATVEEAALALDAMTAAPDDWRPASARLDRGAEGLRIGYARDWFAQDPQANPALIRDHLPRYGRPVLQCLAFGAAVDAEDVQRARMAQTRLTQDMLAAMAPFDLVITATTLTPALPFSAFDGEKAVWTPMRTIPFNVTGQPVLSVPVGFDGDLPLGMQIIGRRGDEDLTCAAGHAFERATDHSVQRPPL
jgi:aspartyl-tRNA(Asn)/glutamyl-tRNA(Gln) amidotransferase subunit A